MTVAMATFRYHGYRRPSQIAGAFSSASRREAMAHIIKSIVNELSKTPFNFNLTVVGLNSLQPAQLLQVILNQPAKYGGRNPVRPIQSILAANNLLINFNKGR